MQVTSALLLLILKAEAYGRQIECASRGLSLGFTGKETRAENESFILCLAKRPSKGIGALFFVVDEIHLFLQGDNAVVQFLSTVACLVSNHTKVCALAIVDDTSALCTTKGSAMLSD